MWMLQWLPYGQGVDWWALGTMLYVMLTGQLPLYDTNTKNCAVSYPNGISKEAESITRRVSWRKERGKRADSSKDDVEADFVFGMGPAFTHWRYCSLPRLTVLTAI
jgi:serine/threonine protein kinase